ncbi:hypothetical protein HDU67_009684, partial [Dinochytrium kinnereticum]
TGSAQRVIREYMNRVGPVTEFTGLIKPLTDIEDRVKDSNGAVVVGDVGSLPGFCDAWRKASENPRFREAQMESGVQTAIGKAQVFDCCVQLGVGGAKEIVGVIGKVKGDEREWVGRFLEERRRRLVEFLGGACE